MLGEATAIRVGNWKLHFNYGAEKPEDPALTGGPALYKLSKDPLEQNSLAAKYPEKVKEMITRAKELLTEVYNNQVAIGTEPGVEINEPPLKARDVWGKRIK